MSRQLKTYLGITFASIFSVWSSYSIHVLPIETQALPILEALLEGTGRAPDQYRIAPYFLITLIRDGISLFVGADLQLRHSILVFDGFLLFLSALALIRHFNCVNDIRTGWLFLIYPFLIIGGYRPTASSILFLSVHAVVLIRKTSAHQKRGMAYIAYYPAFERNESRRRVTFRDLQFRSGRIEPPDSERFNCNSAHCPAAVE